jgi:hypothetical protein
MLITGGIDAYEKRIVATADVPGAFMHAKMDEIMHMKLEGALVKSLVEINPTKYKKFVKHENGKDIMCVRLKKALNGPLQAALLFWQELIGKLLSWVFVLNPYDNCVANKVINNKQCTIILSRQ